MKKILAIVLCLVMLSVSACAEIAAVTYDPIVWSELGVEAVTVALDDFGLWLDIPSTLYSKELTEEEIAGGLEAAFVTEDLSYSISVGFMQHADAADYDALAAIYAESGINNVTIAEVNGLNAMTYVMAEYDMMGAAYLFDEGWVLSFTFTGASNTDLALINTAIISSIRAAE